MVIFPDLLRSIDSSPPFFFFICGTLYSSYSTPSKGRQRATLSPQTKTPERSSRSAKSSTPSKSKIQILGEDSKIKVDREVALGLLVEFDVLPPLPIHAYCCQLRMRVALALLLSFALHTTNSCNPRFRIGTVNPCIACFNKVVTVHL